MERKQPLIIVAGADYGQGSSRDWAAKGVRLAGVEAIVAEGFERIHRTNLVGMGVLPLEFTKGETRLTYAIDGTETFSVKGNPAPTAALTVTMTGVTASRSIFRLSAALIRRRKCPSMTPEAFSNASPRLPRRSVSAG